MLENSVTLFAYRESVEITVEHGDGIQANLIRVIARTIGGVEYAYLYLSEAQLRDLHAKIGARLAEIDAQQPVVDIEGEIECPF